ncbi:MAG: hypothetical protein KKG47_08460 [Proteobacteria bacterium]|nr:hypothetical protein [Pseudomonadota bacterium]MBU1737172.1 hypothetical protein [Pseudomonadota bacterium]
MKKTTLTSLTMSLFFLTTILVVVWMSYNKPRVFILHSYSNDYVWTEEVNVGIERTLANQKWLLVRYHFMKTKKFKDDASHRRAGIAAKNAIDKFRPDVLIAVDDYAQKLVAAKYVNHPTMQIVFAGVNGSIEPYGYYKANNVTGIVERKQVKAIREVILLLAASDQNRKGGNPLRTLFLSDPALSGKMDTEYVDAFDWQPIDHQGSIHVNDYDEWREIVGKAGEMTDFLLVSGYRKLPRSKTDEKFVSPEEIMTWTEENSPVPVIGMNFFNTGDGAMLSVGVSPYEQGEVAAGLALDILCGRKKVNEIPVQVSQQYVISLRNSAIRKRNMEVPKIFEAFARATNNYFD